MIIAGHTFDDTPDSKRKCACGKTWGALSEATRDDIGKMNWAHVGALSESEYNSIEAERQRIRRLSMPVVEDYSAIGRRLREIEAARIKPDPSAAMRHSPPLAFPQ